MRARVKLTPRSYPPIVGNEPAEALIGMSRVVKPKEGRGFFMTRETIITKNIYGQTVVVFDRDYIGNKIRREGIAA